MKSRQKAFTLLEILLVILIVLAIAATAFPLGIDFYQNQQLEIQTQGVLQALRRAQFKAMAMEYDSSFGVYLSQGDYTLFKGDSFAGRDAEFDEVFEIPALINPSGLSEVVFSKLEGLPFPEGTITLSTGGNSRNITINKAGRINVE